jgi:hypothetical protein
MKSLVKIFLMLFIFSSVLFTSCRKADFRDIIEKVRDNGGDKDEDEKDRGDKDEGDKDEDEKDRGDKDEGDKDEDEKDRGDKDEGDKDEDEKDRGDKGNGRDSTGRR